MQIRMKGTSGRFYAVDRDIMHCLPRLLSSSIGETGYDDSPKMMDLSILILDYVKLASEPALNDDKVNVILDKLKALVGEKEYQKFTQVFFLTTMNFYLAAKREVPIEEAEKERDENIILEYHRWITTYRRWPFWRKWLYQGKRWWNSLSGERSDSANYPVQK